MPVGIIIDSAVTAVGGLVGCAVGKKITESWKNLLNNLLGMAALVMGIVLILRVQNLSPVILSLIIGACIGQALQLEKHVNTAANKVIAGLMRGAAADETQLAQISAALVLFCFGGTGWYGALNEGLTGDGSILITKAILDGVTACIFAALLGKIVPCLCVPQLAVYLLLFAASGVIAPMISQSMLSDFSALGGIVTFIAGLRLTGIKKDIPVLNLLPGLIVVFVVSAAWTTLVG